MVLIPCERQDFFYDGSGLTNADEDPLIGLAYICEAKIIPTILSGEICHFPFVYNNKIFDSCTFEPVPNFNPDGELPWCALQVDENKNVKDNQWALCKDEREVIYKSDSTAQQNNFCPLPFIFDGKYLFMNKRFLFNFHLHIF